MLTIRLTRKGKKNQPFFRVVVIDKRRSSKGGRAVEDLGYVDPLTKRKNLKKERVQYWLSKGAKPSDTIHNLLVSEKIIDAKKIHVAKIKKSKEATPTGAQAPAAVVTPEEKPAEPAPEAPAEPAPELTPEEKPAEPAPVEPVPAEPKSAEPEKVVEAEKLVETPALAEPEKAAEEVIPKEVKPTEEPKA